MIILYLFYLYFFLFTFLVFFLLFCVFCTLFFCNNLNLSPNHNDNCTLTFRGNLLCSVGKVRIREMSILMLSTGTMTTFLVNGFKIDAKLLKRFYLKCRPITTTYLKCRPITTTFSAPPRVCLYVFLLPL